MPTQTKDSLLSGLSVDVRPFDEDDSFDGAEYEHLMRQIGIVEGELGTTVSAFNSSI
jgi:hypothetical protein